MYSATNSSRQAGQLPISQQPRPASASSIDNSANNRKYDGEFIVNIKNNRINDILFEIFEYVYYK